MMELTECPDDVT